MPFKTKTLPQRRMNNFGSTQDPEIISLAIHETFQSTVQGEGYWAGSLVDFICLSGCPVQCCWCDTGYAITKAESVKLAVDVLGDRFSEVFALTHTCYAGVKGGCGKCHACLIRDRGFLQAGLEDPIWQFRPADSRPLSTTLH